MQELFNFKSSHLSIPVIMENPLFSPLLCLQLKMFPPSSFKVRGRNLVLNRRFNLSLKIKATSRVPIASVMMSIVKKSNRKNKG